MQHYFHYLFFVILIYIYITIRQTLQKDVKSLQLGDKKKKKKKEEKGKEKDISTLAGAACGGGGPPFQWIPLESHCSFD